MATSIRTETLRWRRAKKGRVLLSDSGGHFDIVCKRCGQRNQDASGFCGECGAFLEWEGERVASELSATASAVGIPSPAAAATTDESSRPAQPAAVTPALPVDRPPPSREPVAARRIRPGDLICGQCGEGNEATRNFCRRCGTTLRDAPAVAVAWWRRILRRRAKSLPPAGSRPAQIAHGPRNARLGPALAKLVALAAVIVVVLFAAVPSLRQHATNEATRIRRSLHPNYRKIALQSATATNAGGCPVPRVSNNSTVYWSTHAATGPIQVLTVTLAADFKGNLDKVGVTPMGPDGPPVGSGNALPYPEELSLSAVTTATPATFSLANPPTFHSFTARVTRPRTIQVSALTIDPGAPGGVCAETALIFYDRT